MTRERTRRLFFALWPDERVRQQLALEAQRVVDARAGRPVPPANFHVTVVFLGPVPQSRFDAVAHSAAQSQGRAFELCLDRLQLWARSGVLCLTARTPPALQALAQQLRSCLSANGVGVQEQALRAHVTLARNMPGRQAPAQTTAVRWPVRDYVLVESQPAQGGSRYIVLERWPLREG